MRLALLSSFSMGTAQSAKFTYDACDRIRFLHNLIIIFTFVVVIIFELFHPNI